MKCLIGLQFPILFILLNMLCTENAVLGLKLVIDHDGGADDAMAIFIALLNERYFNGPEVISLTTVHGNVQEKQAFVNTQRILGVIERQDVPIYRGSAYPFIGGFKSDYYFGKDGLGDNSNVQYEEIEAQPLHAALGLIELSKKYEGNLTVITLGALTNVALALKMDPSFISRLSQLYVAAGHVHSEKYPDGEFNAVMDVEAYHIVVQAATPDKVTVIPFSQIYSSFKQTDRNWRKTVLGAIPTRTMQALNSYEAVSLPTRNIWVNLDPVAISIILNDKLTEEIKYSYNGIILCGGHRGINTNNFTTKEAANVKIIYSVNEELFQIFLLQVFAELNSTTILP